jgi:hypothetical protein
MCFTTFKGGIIQSNTLLEIAGIHSFRVSHQEELHEVLCEITARNEEPEKENRPVKNKLEQKDPNSKRLLFAHDSSTGGSKTASMPLKASNHFKPIGTKRAKTEQNTT